MPDANKFQKLQEVGYTIPVTCGHCIHRDFRHNPRADWGKCQHVMYQHLKHTGPPRGVSIHRAGRCKHATLDPTLVGTFGSFQGMVEET